MEWCGHICVRWWVDEQQHSVLTAPSSAGSLAHHTEASVDNCQYFGVTIDNKLKWTAHIDKVILKLNRLVGICCKLCYKLPDWCLQDIYYSFIHPYMGWKCMVILVSLICTNWSKWTINHCEYYRRRDANVVTNVYISSTVRYSSYTSMKTSNESLFTLNTFSQYIKLNCWNHSRTISFRCQIISIRCHSST